MLKLIRKFHDKVILMGISQLNDTDSIVLKTDKGDIIIKMDAGKPEYYNATVFDKIESGNIVKVSEPKTAKDYNDIQSNLNSIRETILRLMNKLVQQGIIDEKEKDRILWDERV